jgi:hypothetical protein
MNSQLFDSSAYSFASVTIENHRKEEAMTVLCSSKNIDGCRLMFSGFAELVVIPTRNESVCAEVLGN